MIAHIKDGSRGIVSQPKRKWSNPESRSRKAAVPEDAMQRFADDFLEINHIRYIRIPDKIFGWVNWAGDRGIIPEWFAKFFNHTFAGMADNTLLFPIGQYSLACHIELKTEDKKGASVGALHGRQKSNARNERWRIARNSEQFMVFVHQAKIDAELLGKLLERADWRMLIDRFMEIPQ